MRANGVSDSQTDLGIMTTSLVWAIVQHELATFACTCSLPLAIIDPYPPHCFVGRFGAIASSDVKFEYEYG